MAACSSHNFALGYRRCRLQERTKGFTQHTLPALCCLQLQAKTDEGFVKGAFRLCRDHLGVRTVLTPAQFLEQVICRRQVHRLKKESKAKMQELF